MLEVQDLLKRFAVRGGASVSAIADVNFTIEPGEFFTLLGPSGCGKTTTLRCVAGLERPQRGRISLRGNTVFDSTKRVHVDPNQRNIGMVFQSYAIWPHLNVFDNVAFPLRASGRRESKTIAAKVAWALDLVGLGGLVERPATQLSGGQQQRVALARALVKEPDLLLLDEPLSNLDAKLRERMRSELKRLQRELGITTLYVTHDQVESIQMSDRVAVMNYGVIIQEGTPRQIYLEPKDAFTANFIGKTNIFNGKVAASPASSGTGAIELSVGRINCSLPRGVKPSDDVQLLIRPEGIQILEAKPAGTGNNVIPGEILVATFQGDSVEYQIRVGEQECRVKSDAIKELGKSREVFLHLPAERCLVIEKQVA